MSEHTSRNHRYRSNGPRKKRGSNAWLGLFIIGLGTFFLLRQVGMLEEINLRLYWPLILVTVGLFKLITPSSDRGTRMSGLVMMVIGAGLQLHFLKIIHLEWNYVWPVIIIIMGVRIVFSTFFPSHKKKSRRNNTCSGPGRDEKADKRSVVSHEESTDSWINGVVLLGGKDTQVNTQTFQGGRIQSILGSYEIDLTQAEIQNGQATISTTAVMGSIELYVPKHWRICPEVTPIMGSYEDHRRNPSTDPNAPELVIHGEAIMGSIEVRD